MSSSATAPHRRRTQAERRHATRTRLLDATLACLVERGYAGTTTAEVERRAGVSRGARLHHFPTKADLLVATMEHLYAQVGRRYADSLGAVEPSADRFHEGYRLLWKTHVEAVYPALVELLVAARTDPELRTALQEFSARHRRELRQRANSYFPELATRDADGLLETLLATMLGLAVQREVLGTSRNEERVLALLERMTHETFDAGGQDTRSPVAAAAPERKRT